MSKTLKNTLTGLLVAAALIVGFYFGANIIKSLGASNSNVAISNFPIGEKVDIIGTRVGTTTTGVSFYALSASTTYPFKIGSDKTSATIFLKNLATSSPVGSYVAVSILSSNDNYCDTSSTTYSAVQNNVLKSDIHWFDAGNHIKQATAITSINSATTTISWTIPANSVIGREINLEGLNSKCLALEVAASSTILHAQLLSK